MRLCVLCVNLKPYKNERDNLLFTVLMTGTVFAQIKLTPTESFMISGKVNKEKTITIAALDTFKIISIDDVAMQGAKGEVKEKVKNLKGVLLKDLFQGVQFKTENKKDLNRFFLILSATDGFKLVLSWNEVFHAKSCTNIFILTEKDGKKGKELVDRILVIAVDDAKNGHERVKALQQITVEKVK